MSIAEYARRFGLLLAVTVAALPGACNECPDGTEVKDVWVAAVPATCEFMIVRDGGVVSYSAMCGDPAFRRMTVCLVKTPEKPEPSR